MKWGLHDTRVSRQTLRALTLTVQSPYVLLRGDLTNSFKKPADILLSSVRPNGRTVGFIGVLRPTMDGLDGFGEAFSGVSIELMD